MSSITQTAIVTGGSKGIGAAIAKRLASDGFQTIINYSSSENEANSLVAEIANNGGKAKAIRADVSKPSEVKALFDQAEEEWGSVGVFVNNAGIATVGAIADVSDEDFQRLIAINLTGSFNGMREAANRISDGGRIINLSTSIIGSYLPTYGVYAATKAGVEALTRILAKELGTRKVTVNAVAPGPVATELFLKGKSEELLKRITSEIPLGRIGEPEDISSIISFLASSESGWVNGQIIRANGGRN